MSTKKKKENMCNPKKINLHVDVGTEGHFATRSETSPFLTLSTSMLSSRAFTLKNVEKIRRENICNRKKKKGRLTFTLVLERKGLLPLGVK